MDSEKIGKFIKQLREEKNWTQEQLAEKMFCERSKIYKLENGKRNFKLEDLILLGEIFNVNLEELIGGEKKTKKNQEIIEITFKKYLKSQNTKLKRLKVSLVSLVLALGLVVSLILSMYFFNNYKSIRIYHVDGRSKNYQLDNGLLVLSKDKIYLDIGKINPNAKEISIYSEKNNTRTLVYKGEPNHLLYDFYGYEALISYKDFIEQKQDLYVIINNEEIKLNFLEEFNNDKFHYSETEKMGTNSQEKVFTIPTKIKENFICDENTCSLVTKNELMSFAVNILVIQNKD